MSLRLDRLLAIVIKLLSYRRLTTNQLAKEFGVSTRTIYRDMQSISISGIPVIPFQGQNGGWELDPSYLIDRRILNVDDIANIVSALQNAERGLQHTSITQTLDKINSLISPQRRTDIDTKLNHIVIDHNPWCSQNQYKNTLPIIHDAIYNQRILCFEYLNLKMEHSKRHIEPMTLLLKGNSWYLFGFCLDKEDYRLFRLSRMSAIIESTTLFKRRNKSVHDFEEPEHRNKKQISLKLKFHQSILVYMGDYFGFSNLSIDGEYGSIQTKLPESEWLYGFLLSFGDKIQVDSPKRIATELKLRAKKIIQNYQ